MDRRERNSNPAEIILMSMKENQALLWTALPGFVVKFPGSAGGAMTVDVQPTINAQMTDTKGNTSWIQLPVLIDCPILFQGGGGVTATFPITAGDEDTGDECLVVFSSRCIDSWWQNGGIQNQAELRMHNLSDGFAIAGVRSLPNSFAVDTANACLITDDGQTYFKLNPTSKEISAQATGGITLNGVTIDQHGNINTPTSITATGNITSDATIMATTDVKGGGISLIGHDHTSEGPGTPTSPPIAGT